MRNPTALALLAVAALGAVAGVAIRLRVPEPVPAQSVAARPENDEAAAPRASPVAASSELAAAAVAAEPAAFRQPPPAPGNTGTVQAQALLANAASDRSLSVVTAEVLAVGNIARAELIEGAPEHQDVTLRLLAESGDGALRRYATVVAPLCPSVSQQLHGCSTPFGSVTPGQVRTFVLGRGRPDLGALSKLLAHRARWLVLAGPEVARPDDPVLAKVPPELHGWLGRPSCSVFRARVCEAREGRKDERDGRTLAREFDHLSVDVIEVVQQVARSPLRGCIRLAQEPFVWKPDVRSLTVGREYWFATDDTALFQVLRAFAPRP